MGKNRKTELKLKAPKNVVGQNGIIKKKTSKLLKKVKNVEVSKLARTLPAGAVAMKPEREVIVGQRKEAAVVQQKTKNPKKRKLGKMITKDSAIDGPSAGSGNQEHVEEMSLKKDVAVKKGSTQEERLREKIERKKARKAAEKLKRKQKKQQMLNNNSNKESKTEQKDSKKVTSEKDAHISGASADNKVLTKKLKKAEKRNKLKETKTKAERRTDSEIDPAAIVFVGNLPVTTKRVQLVRLFKDYAPVNAIRLRTAGGQVMFKHKMRKQAGSLNAYVVLKDKETAERALALNGIEFKGNHLRVTPADKNSFISGKIDTKRLIFVGNLKYTATEESLRGIFSSCGEIEYVRCLREGEKGCKGVAYVCFKSPEAVGLALELNETLLDERPIHVERYNLKKLGAKEERDAMVAQKQKSKKSVKQQEKSHKPGSKEVVKSDDGANTEHKQKKSKFRGVKINGIKKKQKKKKATNEMSQLAKKIAPRSK